jgi:CRP/FNR family transcriptional regulator, cyclic AMP receptor protein
MEKISTSLREKAEMLDKTNWAKEFSWKEIENLVKYLFVSKVPRETIIIHEGDHDAYMCIIVSGNVSIVKEDASSKAKVLSNINQGKTFGEMTLFDGEPRSATVRTDEDSTLLVLTKDGMNRLLSESPKLGIKLLYKLGMLISQRLRMTSGKLIDYI